MKADSLKRWPKKALATAFFTFMTGSWAADALKGDILFKTWLPELENYALIVNVVVIGLFCVSSLLLYKFRTDFLGIRAISQRQTVPQPGLVIILSTPNSEVALPNPFTFPLNLTFTDRNTEQQTQVVLQGTSIDKDIDALNAIRWNWQQLLRSIGEHKDVLKHVYLIGSSGRSGSAAYVDQAAALIKQYCRKVKTVDTNVSMLSHGVDFEQFDSLLQELRTAIESLRRYEILEKHITIDITGGQKTTSIAGAAVTLNSNLTFQYVQTNTPFGVVAYDVTVQSPVSGV